MSCARSEERKYARMSRVSCSPIAPTSPTGMIEVPLGRNSSTSERRISAAFASLSVTRILSDPSARTTPTITRPSLRASV